MDGELNMIIGRKRKAVYADLLLCPYQPLCFNAASHKLMELEDGSNIYMSSMSPFL